MVLTPSAALANATATLWLTTLQVGSAASRIELYTGSKPANTLVAPDGSTQILLGTVTCTTVAAGGVDVGTVTNNVLTFNTPMVQDSSADNAGTATWARVKDGNGLAAFDVDVSDLGGNAALKLNTTIIAAGGPIAVSSFVITF